MTDITDKYEKFKVPYSTNEKHSADEFDPKENGGLDNPSTATRTKCWMISVIHTLVLPCVRFLIANRFMLLVDLFSVLRVKVC